MQSYAITKNNLVPIKITQDKIALDNFSVAYQHDDSNKLSINEVKKLAFKNINNKNSFSVAHMTTWYKVRLENHSQIPRTLYLHNNLAYMSKQIDIYEFSREQQLDQNRYLLLNSNIGDKLNGSVLCYPIHIKADSEKTIYIKNQALIHQLLDISLYDEHQSIHALINNKFYSNLLIAILFALAFYNSMLFLLSRRQEFIYYSLYLINASIGLFYMYGSVFHNFGLYGKQVYWFNLTAILVPLFLALFVKSIFDISKKEKINRLLNLLISLSIINLLIAVFVDLSLAIKLVNGLFIFSFLLLIYVGMYFYQKKHPLAKLFIFTYGVYIISFAITIFTLMGLFPYNYFSFHASGFGLVIEALLFSYLLHYRIQLLEQEVVKQKNRLILINKKVQMGDMIAAITHQWKQPLTAISSIVTFLQYRCDDVILLSKQELRTKIIQINDKVSFLVSTVDDFRDFYKPDNIDKKTDIAQLIDKALMLSKDDMQAANISVKTDFNFNKDIDILQNELLHIILNLIQNSKDAFKVSSEEHKIIKIIGFNLKEQTIIDFIDNAGGIAEHHLPHVFDEFYTTKEKNDGTGLGLYLSKYILEQHMNGHIAVKNSNNGAIFRISIG